MSEKMAKESIVEKCSQPEIFTFNGITVRPFDGHHIYMEIATGEGTVISKSVFYGALLNLFNENF